MGMGAFVINSNPISDKPVKKMSLDSFMKEAGGRDLNAIFQNVKTGSYSACHVDTSIYRIFGLNEQR